MVSGAGALLEGVAYVVLPAAIGYAVLRHRLWGIDVARRLDRLAQRHATREEAVDRLLRGRVLVDLYRVVRQGIRASVESYSIKRLEGLYGFVREEDLTPAERDAMQAQRCIHLQRLGRQVHAVARIGVDDIHAVAVAPGAAAAGDELAHDEALAARAASREGDDE